MNRSISSLLIVTYLGSILAYTLWLAIAFAAEPDLWRYGDWAINYSAGFIRRGLTGEIGLLLHNLLGLPLPWVLFAMGFVAYAVFLWFFGRLALAQKDRLMMGFLIGAPFTALFHLADWQGSFRKEIIAFALLAALAHRFSDPRSPRGGIGVIVAIALLAIAVLTHEVLYLALPFMLFFAPLARSSTLQIGLAAALVFVVTCIAVLASGNETMATAICASLGDVNAEPKWCLKTGAIFWLGADLQDAFQLVAEHMKNNLTGAPIVVLLVALGFYPAFRAISSAAKSNPELRTEFRRLGLAFAIAVLISLPLFLVAADWGRLIYILLTCLALVTLSLTARYEITLERSEFQTWAMILALPVYTLGWSIAHYDGLLKPGIVYSLPFLDGTMGR